MRIHIILFGVAIVLLFLGIEVHSSVAAESVAAAGSANSTVQELLTSLSLFIQNIVLPLLFSIAFLFFLVNMVRYFILGGASETEREKAKRSAIYGIAAFVFLLTLWGLVSILVKGIGIENDSSACPDYLGDFCGNTIQGSLSPNSFPVSGTSNFSGGSNTSGTRNTNNTTSGTNNTGSTGSNAEATTVTVSGLAELIFGTGKDSATFTNYPGTPRALLSSPTISQNATCQEGLASLTLASRTETSQAAYVLYKNTEGATRWTNVTDANSTNHISYDKDELNALLAVGNSNVHVIHMHPRTRSESLDLTMEGHGPSTADMKAMCANNTTNITYGTVDWGGIWLTQQQNDTCAYSTAAQAMLPIIETYAALAAIESSQRQDELTQYIQSSVTPSQYKDYFAKINIGSLASLTSEQVLNLSMSQQTYASTTVTYNKTVDTFCADFMSGS